MRFKTMDGMQLEAESFQLLAEALWKSTFDPDPTIEEWMRSSAKRAAMYNGSVIRTESPTAHVEDLIQAGFITQCQ
ncbi:MULTISPECIES: hypothetical protein [Bilophila]|uniref:hypothetical protein n=1 Tax=Bilophila TaxID=35832 RepID=UPI0002238103|nr:MULTISPECIES: hypothetical protein [Bilophila]EGW42727.1 hypothetical protein HMPREF0178_00021 [Bilophila sp. 4_1_30]MBS5374889.1 hypothetical protein [Bilophila wadsworthia]